MSANPGDLETLQKSIDHGRGFHSIHATSIALLAVDTEGAEHGRTFVHPRVTEFE